MPESKRKRDVRYSFTGNPSIKDAIEAIGVPHTEVDLILVNGESVSFSYRLKDGETVSVYPQFESFDIGSVTRVRSQPLRETTFIADVHLGKLVRLLRMLGFDTYYHNALDDKRIADISLKEKRIILTRDVGLLKRKAVKRGYWIRSQQPEEQVKEVIRRFHLQDRIRPLTRCIACNGLIEAVRKDNIRDKLEENTEKYYSQFYTCTECGKIYWPGSHVSRMKRTIAALRDDTITTNDH